MNNIAVHMRISGVTVNDNDVESRNAATIILKAAWLKEKDPIKIVSKAVEVALSLGGKEMPPQSLGNEVQAAIQKKSPSFLYDERPLDVSVCSGMAMLSILDSNPVGAGWSINDVYAIALWSALSYQPVLSAERRENLRREVLTAAFDYSSVSAEKARERSLVPDPTDLKIEIDSESGVTSNFKEAIVKTIVALRTNAALDREEIDFLWWSQLGRSRLLDKQLSDISEPTRIVAAGIEAAMMLRRLPCEVHREIVLRSLDQDPQLDLVELLEIIGQDRLVLSSSIIKSMVIAYPTVFPLLNAMVTGEIDEVGSSIKRHVSEWGGRALLEATFARMMAQGGGQV